MPGTEEIPEIFSSKVADSVWDACSDLKEGDFILFHNRVLHCSLPNISPEYRCSVDTRWTTKEDYERATSHS